ncbi:4-phosphoerythronate dehydrogenase [Rhodohalobacter sp. 614A]|uniref:4-phosphoerythronate dehydrogenase n=1 Tax=Rhodohalobacter sp. 614A TaxID=2908649 RepID=UPI001F364E7A|nr:4-phosphoerythronate dehydrogenase [Rhodohalobacter sp. 614A]
MKVLADKHLYALEQLVPNDAELKTYDPESGFPEGVTNYDALLIRTVTKLNSETLPKSGNLKFVGSATAGFDHVDINHLKSLGIEFARSEGCNANAVAEYMLTALYRWGQLRDEQIEDLKIGVIGCGNTGGSLIGYLRKLGIEYVPYDPPKADREEKFTSAELHELLSCDVLTFHTPLTNNGVHSTYHICNEKWLENSFKLIINASRGGVVDEKALLESKRLGLVRDFILDVWENEPLFSGKIADQALIATPHIAGYSREAKWKASEIVVRTMVEFFGEPYSPPNQNELPENSSLADPERLTFADFLWKNHKIDFYDQELRKLIGLSADEKGQKFADLRSNTSTRFEFRTVIGQYSNRDKLPEEIKIFG